MMSFFLIYLLLNRLIPLVNYSPVICFQRDKQKVSIVVIIILVAMWLFIFISLFVAVGQKLQWLEFLYFLSYVKLAVTLVKYIPQVRETTPLRGQGALQGREHYSIGIGCGVKAAVVTR